MKCASQQRQEPLDTGAEDATLLEATTKSTVKTITENTNLCVIMICKVYSQVVSKSPINPITNPNPICSHTQTRDSM
jgi:hypothetical protein